MASAKELIEQWIQKRIREATKGSTPSVGQALFNDDETAVGDEVQKKAREEYQNILQDLKDIQQAKQALPEGWALDAIQEKVVELEKEIAPKVEKEATLPQAATQQPEEIVRNEAPKEAAKEQAQSRAAQQQRQQGTKIAANTAKGPQFPPPGQAFALTWVQTPVWLLNPATQQYQQATLYTQLSVPVTPLRPGEMRQFNFPNSTIPILTVNDGKTQHVYPATQLMPAKDQAGFEAMQRVVDQMIWSANALGMNPIQLTPANSGPTAIPAPLPGAGQFDLRLYALQQLSTLGKLSADGEKELQQRAAQASQSMQQGPGMTPVPPR